MQLFNQTEIGTILSTKLNQLNYEIENYDEDYILNIDTNELTTYLVHKYALESVELIEESITVDQLEANIESIDYGRLITNRGTINRFHIPFVGNNSLFNYRPSTYYPHTPDATINNDELILSYPTLDHNAEQIKTNFSRDLTIIKQLIEWAHKDILQHNKSLEGITKTTINRRREKLLANRSLASSLGFPIKERDNAPKTYSVPNVRKKTSIKKPVTKSTTPFEPEPALDTENYNHILSVIDNMVQVMERSPKAFSGMEEEHIRQHFLVQLNGHYEGQATGETFNYEGKTDIIIRSEDKNIFIAECKFWRGQKEFLETIEQILGYTSWRDTKTAILLFNRNKNLSKVIEQIPTLLEKHNNFKQHIEYNREAGWKAIFGNRDDPSRELILTIHLYDVPK